MWRETHDTSTLELAPNGQGPSFRPGQFNMLWVPGIGEVPISLSGDPAAETALHTTRAVGAVTRAIHALGPGDVLGVRGPFGTAWPLDGAEGADLVLVAGGIGLAPLRPALYQALARRERFGRLLVLYGARDPKELLFRRELHRWRARFDLEVEVTVDRAAEGWFGEVGVVTKLIGWAPFEPANTVALVCGPEIMMRFAAAELRKRGVAPQSIHLSLERNMKCGLGLCGHCQYGPLFVCRDGPVVSYDKIAPLLNVAEV